MHLKHEKETPKGNFKVLFTTDQVDEAGRFMLYAQNQLEGIDPQGTIVGLDKNEAEELIDELRKFVNPIIVRN